MTTPSNTPNDQAGAVDEELLQKVGDLLQKRMVEGGLILDCATEIVSIIRFQSQALIARIRQALPEKLSDSTTGEYIRGFDNAIDQVIDILTTIEKELS